MKINGLKLFALGMSLSLPMTSFGDTSYKLNKNLSIEFSNSCSSTTSCVTSTTTSSTTTSSTTTTITTTLTTTTPVDVYASIRNLESLNNNDLDISELDIFIERYASFCKMDYEDAISVINSNISSIENDYSSIRGGIMTVLFTYATDNGLLSPYTENRETKELSLEEQENLLLEFSDNLGLCDDDKLIILAAFREETGCGTSYKCVMDNNYGGIRIYGEAGCNGEYGKYSTPEYGMYREVRCISNKLNNIRENGINDLNSVVYNFACRYNPDYADMYSSKILNWVNNIRDEYESFEKVLSK